ncbi:MAG: hypothetical protein AB1560_03595 [Pseudomonadota bacterium]
MKLDTKIDRKHRNRRALLWTVAAVLGLAGNATGSLADDFAGLADPTQPAYGTTGKAGSAGTTGSALQSTFVSASQRRAVINGRTYKVGDKYGGGVIADIQPYEVVVKQANRESRLRLMPKLAKQAHMVRVPANSREGGKDETDK